MARQRAKTYYHAHREQIRADTKARRDADIEYQMWKSAQARAKQKNIEFAIEPWEVCMPRFCPVFGVALVVGNGRVGPNSPTLDRIDSTKGYVSGNVVVVSQRANTIKSDATPRELRRIAKFYSELWRSQR